MVSRRRYQAYGFVLMLALMIPAVPAVKRWMGSSPYIAPIYWGVALLAIYCLIPRIHVPGRLCMRGTVAGFAATGAAVYLALRFGAGVLLKQLAASPYDISPSGIFYNMLAILPMLAARESIRAYCLGIAGRAPKNRSAYVAVLTLVMIGTEISFHKIGNLQGQEAIFIYVTSEFIPLIARNCLVTMLVLYGSTTAGIVYLGLIEAFQKCFPFLPDLPWLADSAIGITFPVLYLIFVRERYHFLNGDEPAREEGGMVRYLAGLFAAVAFSWFCVGVFTVYPSVVLTGSMEPGIEPGDVVLIRKLTEEKEVYQLVSGDVINFKREDITITHRIIDVLRDEAGNVSFQTKGDNNSSADEEIVMPNDVNGRVVDVVPKVGLPILMLKSGEQTPEGVVDDAQEDSEVRQ